MLDLKFIRSNPQEVKEALKNRHTKVAIDKLLLLDKKRREYLQEVEGLKNQKNVASKEIGKIISKDENAEKKKQDVKTLSQKISKIDKKVGDIDSEIASIWHNIPNIPAKDVPVGKDDSSNKIVKEWNEPTKLPFKAKDHIELAGDLDIIDFGRAAKVAASHFSLFKGQGARLVRALINFMLDTHTSQHGYQETWMPALVCRESMFSTGQLPKMEKDMYKLQDDDLYLIPTAEVPVTNMYRNEIIDEKQLPLSFCAYTPCFRREAGSYGKDTRGLIRVHQFDKVELVKFERPQDSHKAHEEILSHAEAILQALKLPYRISVLSTGELSFAAAKCYDIEAWAPGCSRFLEVSSVSNFNDFQARRASIKYRHRAAGSGLRTDYVHTLNGSGVALARTIICIMENYQQPDGSIDIPQVLRPYMAGQKSIKAQPKK
jgi:seryl-tRNA synthetase